MIRCNYQQASYKGIKVPETDDKALRQVSASQMGHNGIYR